MLCQHTISHQHELGLATSVVHLELRAEFATRHWFHILLTDDEVGIQRLDIGQGFLDGFVGVEVVDIAQVGIHKVQELTVVVNQYDGKLLSLRVNPYRLSVNGQLAADIVGQCHLTLVVQFQTVFS